MTIDNLTRREFLGMGIAATASLAVPELVFGGGQKLTPTQEENLERYGYPWDVVDTTSVRIGDSVYVISKDIWKKIYEANSNVQRMFRNSNKMKSLYKQLTDENVNNDELHFVVLKDNNIIFKNNSVRKYAPRGYYWAYESIGTTNVNKIEKLAEVLEK